MECHNLLQGIFPTLGWNRVSYIAGRLFTVWATREAHHNYWLACTLFDYRKPLCNMDYPAQTETNTLIAFQPLSHVQLFAAPRTAAHHASLFFTNSQSLLKLISITSVMAFNHIIFHHPLLLLLSIFLSIRVFSNDQLFPSGSQSIGASLLSMNIQGRFPSGWTCLTSLQSKGFLRVFFNIRVQKNQIHK